MNEYRGYEIEVIKNNEKEYPFKAIAKKGENEIKHKGRTETEAIDLVKQGINIVINKVEKNNFQ
ncbi:hypothetical protein [Caproiciproducens sp. MSJ-32]|uniref:hypothetical protein n=1 Tax=Caproiciproducens sp. MSJ-32 TaxID=2841527 RepID=UPI001C111107|nr:hypothetical protein [Caproiciproducens sp. MSJ-32]MBU5454222.1 hypothetical protein [Caproiciproducens sp. MSJ-32]